jgi:hypothetical protein
VRWTALILLLANLGVAGYLLFIGREPASGTDVRALELNADKVRSLRAAAAPGSAGKSGKAAAACLEWGSFTAGELERAQAELAKLGAGKMSVREFAESAAWWVHVPPLKSRDEAERRRRDIEDAGVKDARVVTEGDRWRNAISLGIFKSEEAANAYLARMKESKVRNVAVAQRNDLLRLSAIVIADPSPAQVTRVMELRTGFAGTEVKAVPCP